MRCGDGGGEVAVGRRLGEYREGTERSATHVQVRPPELMCSVHQFINERKIGNVGNVCRLVVCLFFGKWLE